MTTAHPQRSPGERPPGEHEVKGLSFRDELAEGPGATDGPQAPGGPGAAARPARRITWRMLVLPPAALALVVLALYLWITNIPLDAIERNSLGGGNVMLRLRQHIGLTAVSTFWVLVIAIPLGIALTRRGLRRAAPLVTAVANIGQAAPAIGLLALLVIWLGIGPSTAVIGMVAYAVLPVLSNTVAGLRAIDPQLVEAARGIGMSAAGVLRKVELPLAVPLILAGVRTALVLNVGTATLATFGGGGGLGDLITSGIQTQRMPVLIVGSVLTVVLALFVDWLATLAETALTPRGLEA
ncbi:permease [Streptomyces subrutilus]|uniref:Permease n=1 Tax=Streptomyces subrutilus TaxID=36818 RepID=A0A5P2UM45_9ACTN|nr:ABC transporter permease [Streptomyces subrutilus]QEU80406.1 ABC transporter permease [Streptomyces subrutilus]GGZ75821.1 permease [Streptomyces subrutilus]